MVINCKQYTCTVYRNWHWFAGLMFFVHLHQSGPDSMDLWLVHGSLVTLENDFIQKHELKIKNIDNGLIDGMLVLKSFLIKTDL